VQEMVEEMEGDNFELACLIRNQLWQHGIAWFSGTGLAGECDARARHAC